MDDSIKIGELVAVPVADDGEVYCLVLDRDGDMVRVEGFEWIHVDEITRVRPLTPKDWLGGF